MITVRASILESVRKDPATYGRLIATNGLNTSGGSHGMFAYMVDTARAVHVGKLNMREAVGELHSKFLRFRDIPQNKEKQERLTEQLIAHLRNSRKQGFKWVDGSRKIQWGITKNVMLTGMTPWVVQQEDKFFSFLMAEKTFDWESQLRFPLFQKYLSKTTIDCPPELLQIGFYFADTNTFDLLSFSKTQMKFAVDETGILFNTIYREYEKKKLGK